MGLSRLFLNKLKKHTLNEGEIKENNQNSSYRNLQDDLNAGCRVYKSQGTIYYGIGNICDAIAHLRASEGMPIITHRDNDPNSVYYCLYDFATDEDKERWIALKGSTKEKVLSLGAGGYFQNPKSADDTIKGQIGFTFFGDGSFLLTETK